MGGPNDDKLPNALNFSVLRLAPDQMYVTVRDVRTKDDAQVACHLMVFYEIKDIEKMLDSTNDPIGDFINAISADVMSFGASKTYEQLLEHTEKLSEIETFPTVASRMASVGYNMLKVVYRGYSTSAMLQAMHDEAIAKRTQLRLSSETARVEQAESTMILQCKEERSAGERELQAAAARHQMELDTLQAERSRSERDADHAQAMRFESERAEARLQLLQREHDEEIRRATALQALGVDLTKLLCVSAERAPDHHLRVDSSNPTALHLTMPQARD